MSQKKIIFFVIVGLVLVSLIATVVYISKQKKTTSTTTTSLKIWITDGTTDSYKLLIDGFKKYAPEYNNTDIIVEKQTSDADRYRTLLLSTLTEWNGPDIFMLQSGEDDILETKIESIPSSLLDFSDFDKRYDDLFQDLISSSESGSDKTTTLKWVPLAYETLGVFYNKSLIRTAPKTWNDLENLYRESSADIYPSNLGLGPTYVPNMIDILPIWLVDADANRYSEVASGKNGLSSYLDYANLEVGTSPTDESSDVVIAKNTLSQQKSDMIDKKNTTLDKFMQWEIALIIGYPSLILELEKSGKRVGTANSNTVILTDRLPQSSSQSATNIGRYTYFGISKLSANGMASVKFLEYLMTPEAQRLYMNEHPYLIPAQSEFYSSVASNSLSETLSRTKLSAFIPSVGERVSIFQYGLKSQFERYLREGIDTTDTPDIDAIADTISREISCEISSSIDGWESKDCTSE